MFCTRSAVLVGGVLTPSGFRREEPWPAALGDRPPLPREHLSADPCTALQRGKLPPNLADWGRRGAAKQAVGVGHVVTTRGEPECVAALDRIIRTVEAMSAFALYSRVMYRGRSSHGSSGAWSGNPIRDTSCCCHPLTGVPYLRPGPRRCMVRGIRLRCHA